SPNPISTQSPNPSSNNPQLTPTSPNPISTQSPNPSSNNPQPAPTSPAPPTDSSSKLPLPDRTPGKASELGSSINISPGPNIPPSPPKNPLRMGRMCRSVFRVAEIRGQGQVTLNGGQPVQVGQIIESPAIISTDEGVSVLLKNETLQNLIKVPLPDSAGVSPSPRTQKYSATGDFPDQTINPKSEVDICSFRNGSTTILK
ncbi:hypothetical protein ACKFKF_18330, partial [Phormidesmis sp. 146-12]